MSDKLRYPYGRPLTGGLLKIRPEDFRVDEHLGFIPSGDGEHLFLHIEKTNLTTFDLVDRVARDFDLKQRDIGYSGLKDKQAVTRQWLSLQLPGQMRDFQMPSMNGYQVLDQGWHHRKLKPGTHCANTFEVVIRDISDFNELSLQQIELIKREGMANYFGQQRFGEQADNVSRALRVFTNPRKTRKLSRSKKSLYISALRSYLFNQILSRRIENDLWSEPVPGDIFMLAGSRSIFTAAIDEEVYRRYQEFDISSTASLVGEGNNQLSGQAKEIEDTVCADNTDIIECLHRLKAKQQMRSLRVKVEGFDVRHKRQEQILMIQARLPRGCYFTTLLNHFINTCQPS